METELRTSEMKIIKLFIVSEGKEITGEIVNDQIKLLVDEVTINGIITNRKANEISVAIEKPYEGITETSNSIPLIALRFFNYTGDSGTKKAMMMLYNIYRFCVWVETRKHELEEALNKYDLTIEYETFFEPTRQLKQKRITELLERVLSIRKKLRAGEIDNLAYERQIMSLKRELKQSGKDIEVDADKLFHECFWGFRDTPLELVSQETVIQYLKIIFDV